MHIGRLAAVGVVAVVMNAPVTGVGRQAQPAPVFKSSGVTVPIYATVTDARGRLVTDLPADAFSIFDDGAERPLTVFERKVLPLSVLMVLDSSESMRESIGLLRESARHFIRNMQPQDRVEIGTFNEQIRWVRPFTNDQRELNRILDFFTEKRVANGTALWPAVHEGLRELNTVVDGRKVLLIFSDGEGNWGKFSDHPFLARATADDVMVYAISLKTQYRDFSGRRVTSVLDNWLPLLAKETGGGYFELDRGADLAATFARVAEELHHQYWLGFDATVLDDTTHEIVVTVKGDGLSARARRSYFAARPK